MPMGQRLDLLTLGVRDLAAARRFYVDGLGWEPTLDLDEVVFLQVGYGLLLGLFPADELARDMHGDAAVATADGTPTRMSLAHIVGSEAAVDDAVAHAVRAGGTVVKPPQRAAFGGYHAYVADPDGFAWEIAHNPGHSVATDGRVSIGPIEP